MRYEEQEREDKRAHYMEDKRASFNRIALLKSVRKHNHIIADFG